MGAVEFMEECEGYSVLEAFGELSKKYITEYGNDEYNGTISTCSFRSLYKIASKCGKTTAQQAYQYIEKNGRKMTKRVADAVDCGVTGYDMFTIKKTAAANKKSPKYELRYAVYEYAEEREPCIVAHCKTKTEADRRMLKFAADNISKNIITSHYEVKNAMLMLPMEIRLLQVCL